MKDGLAKVVPAIRRDLDEVATEITLKSRPQDLEPMVNLIVGRELKKAIEELKKPRGQSPPETHIDTSTGF